MASGIPPRALGCASLDRTSSENVRLGVHFVYKFEFDGTNDSESTVNHNSNVLYVVQAFGIMTGAGAALDTAVVNRIRQGTTAAITDTADLSVFADTEQFDFSEIDDDYNRIYPGDSLNVTVVSNPTCLVLVVGIWMED